MCYIPLSYHSAMKCTCLFCFHFNLLLFCSFPIPIFSCAHRQMFMGQGPHLFSVNVKICVNLCRGILTNWNINFILQWISFPLFFGHHNFKVCADVHAPTYLLQTDAEWYVIPVCPILLTHSLYFLLPQEYCDKDPMAVVLHILREMFSYMCEMKAWKWKFYRYTLLTLALAGYFLENPYLCLLFFNNIPLIQLSNYDMMHFTKIAAGLHPRNSSRDLLFAILKKRVSPSSYT